MTEHERAPGWLSQFAQDAPRYLLIDCHLGNPLREAFEAHGVSDADYRRLTVLADAATEQDPLLIGIDGLAPALLATAALQAAREMARSCLGPRSVCGFINSTAPMDQVAHHIQKRARYRPADRARGISFRFYDPRVMTALHSMLDAGQRAALLGPVSRWGFLDHLAAYQTLDNPGEPGPPVFRLTRQQFSDLGLNATVFQSMEYAKAHRMRWTPDMPGQLRGFLHDAARLGIDEDGSKAAYAALQWMIVQGLADSGLLDSVMQAYRCDAVPLKDMLDHLAPELFPIQA